MTSPLYTCISAETSGYFSLQVVPEEAPECTRKDMNHLWLPNAAKTCQDAKFKFSMKLQDLKPPIGKATKAY
jgi:hypothetical protein